MMKLLHLISIGLLVYLAVLFLTSNARQVKTVVMPYEYVRGWSDGYKDGHKFKPSERPFIIPMPPIPTDSTGDYMNGYKLGVHRGYDDVTKPTNK